jgi:hypothetical protein
MSRVMTVHRRAHGPRCALGFQGMKIVFNMSWRRNLKANVFRARSIRAVAAGIKLE